MAHVQLTCGAVMVALSLLAGCGKAKSPEAVTAPKAARPKPVVKRLEQNAVDSHKNESGKQAKSVPEVATGPLRPPDTRLQPDGEDLRRRGIARYESKRLRLYTDIDAERAKRLPPLVDALYDALVAWFGPLPPDDAGGEFQMTGYLMADPARFEASSLVPLDLGPIRHGRHRGAEFWMADQASDYYLAHLLLHEATHCVMTIVPNPLQSKTWYIEGMAELFATHRPGPPSQFGVMPDAPDNFLDLGRIRLINDAVAEGRTLNAKQVFDFTPDDYLENPPYAWSWALCWYLANHPETRERFRTVQARIDIDHPHNSFLAVFHEDQHAIAQGFWMFVNDLCHGYDLERAAIEFRIGKAMDAGEVRVSLRAERGWQSSGLFVEAGRRYRLVATGRYVVGASTVGGQVRPWTCEPQGITLRYFEGEPLGKLLGTVREERPGQAPGNLSMRAVSALGRESEWTAQTTGTLYLRVNDAWNSLADNSGELQVTISEQK